MRPPVLPGADPRDLMRRPGVVTLLAILCALFGAMVLLAGMAFLVPGVRKPAALAIGTGLLLLAGLDLATAVGLWKLKRYGRTLLMVLSCLGLLAVPIGTIVSILLLIYLTRPGVHVLFSGVDPERLSGDQMAALRDVRKSGLGIAVGVLLVVFGMIGGVGVVAAIAIPNFLSAVQRGRQMRAAADLQGLGERLEDFARASGSYPASGTMDDLARTLGAGKTVTVPTTDPWGHAYLYVAWKRSAASVGPDAYLMASAGMDGVWEDTGERGYARGTVTSFNGDIVFSNGQFIRAPAAVQSRPTGHP
jgi:type II secretory pathway pseudopilin PulG